MKTHNIDIAGSPYFPGVAVGKLHNGMHNHVAKHIVLIREDEVSSFATLPAGIIVVDAAPFSHTMYVRNFYCRQMIEFLMLLFTGVPFVRSVKRLHP